MKRLLYPLLAMTAACTVVVRPPAEQPPPQQAPPVQAPPPGPSYAVTLGVPPGHLPDPGECRIWYPGTPPGRQPRPRSRSCEGILDIAPAGSWIVYRPIYDRRLVYVRVVDDRRAGYLTRVWIYDYDTYRFIREEAPQDDRPRYQPPQQPPPQQPPPVQPPPQEPPVETPPPLSPLARAAPLGVPNDELPEVGQCRMWIPGAQLSQQPQPRSRACQGIVAISPARNWVIYRPSDDSRLAYVGVVSERRPGALIRILVYDIGTTHLVREEAPQNPWPPLPPPPVQPPPQQPPAQQPPPQQPPPVQPPPQQLPPQQPPPQQPPPQQPPPVQPPPQQPPPAQPPPAQPPSGPSSLNVPPGHLPDAGQCRLWIPGVPPGLQPRSKSRSCDGIAADARAGSWILYRPANDDKVVHVRVVDAHRAGVVVRVWVYDIQSKRLLREENP